MLEYYRNKKMHLHLAKLSVLIIVTWMHEALIMLVICMHIAGLNDRNHRELITWASFNAGRTRRQKRISHASAWTRHVCSDLATK
jgi:hypothetical protein